MRLCTGSILDDDADAIVIPVNCVGTLGAGLARQAVKAFPALLREYRQIVDVMSPGSVRPVRVDDHWFFLAATKQHWLNPSELLWVRTCIKMVSSFTALPGESPFYPWHSVAIPPLGCGLEGLALRDVVPIITELLMEHDARVYVPRRVRG